MTNAQLTLSKTKDKVITTYKKVEEKLGLLFIVVVIIPTLCSIIYFGFWASDVYISQSQFVIRTAQNPTNPAIGDYTIASSLTTSAVLQDSAAISGYITSMDGLKEVNKDVDLVKLFTSHNIDIFNRFASFRWNESLERLLVYLNGKVITVNVDPISFVTTLEIRSFTPESAQKINEALLRGSEAIVNEINERTRRDLITFSEKGVNEAKQSLEKVNAELTLLTKSSSQNKPSEFVAKFQMLYLERDAAERRMGIALDALKQAGIDAQHQSIYLERTVKPNLPGYAMEPTRIINILTTLVLVLMLYVIFKIINASVQEHHD